MYTLTKELKDFHIDYPLEQIAPLEDILFLDIETTGFTAKSSSLYLIGTAFYEQGSWYIRQWFAENSFQEAEILKAFSETASFYKYLFHFNGNHFDLPYLSQKYAQYEMSCNFDTFQGIDLYRRISACKSFLKLPNCKQKTVENYLDIDRTDPFNGGELIEIYRNYASSPSDSSREILLCHNFEDIKGMLQIIPILSYCDIFDGRIRARKVQANHYRDFSGNTRRELLMTLVLPVPLPKPISAYANDCYFKAEGDQGILRVPIFEEELKYFYANYRDYYYLPDEDIALHKSIASFVDHEHRIPATAATCYTRKYASYLPQWDILMEPFFKRDYRSKGLFFELTDELKKDRAAFTRYAGHVLEMISSSY